MTVTLTAVAVAATRYGAGAATATYGIEGYLRNYEIENNLEKR